MITAYARFFAVLIGLLIAGSLGAPRSASAQEFVANQIEGLINSDTMTVDIQGLSGAISGNVRIESVTVSDPQGVFLTATDLALDWSPFSLVRSNVSVENLTAGQIVLERLPVGQPPAPEQEDAGGGFSLPSITADIGNIAIDELILGEAIAGTRARLSAKASLSLADDPVNLALKANIERLDQPGTIGLDFAFAPDANQLTVNVQASEPQGGLVATLLDIPDRPAVSLSVNGSGPLSNFMANGELNVADEQAASLTARVNEVETGRRVNLALSVAAARFVPDAYSRYVDGGANLDAQVVLNENGTYQIEQAQLASNAIRLTAQGSVDPNGSGNDLEVALTSAGQSAIELAFGETRLTIQAFNAAITGALANAQLDVTAQLPAGGWGPYQASGVDASVKSSGFNITGAQGPLQIVATATGMAAPDGIQQRVLTAPLRIEVNGALTENGLRFDPSTAVTETAKLNVQGTAALNFSVFDLTLDSTFQTSAVSAALLPIAGEELGLAGNVVRTPSGGFRLSNLAVRSSGLSVAGNAALENETVSADITGRLSEASNVNASLSGTAEFALTASGPLDKPNVDLTVDGNQLSINGQELADLKVSARGTLASESPTGTLKIMGTLDGAPLEGSAELRTQPNGDREIVNLLIRQDENRVTGDIVLTEAFTPLGSIVVAIQDLGPLAALGGLDASGDVSGTIALDRSADGMPIARPEITANNLTLAGTTLQGAAIDLDVSDYLGTPFATGSIRATAIDTGAIAVSDLDVQLSRDGEFNALAATAQANGVPIDLGARARFAPNETLLAVTKLIADIPQARVELRNNAEVRIVDGTTSLSGFDLAVGGGSLSLEGSAGERLDLSATLDAVPAAVAGPFVSGVDPAGTLSGTAQVSGTSANPTAIFDILGRELTTQQLVETEVPPVNLRANGRYENSVLTLSQANATFGEGSLDASGSIGDTYDLTATLDALPVGLANGFVSGLDASGDISGNARVTGPRNDPNATFSLSGSGITTPEVSKAGIQPLTLDISGAYASGTATIERANVVAGQASLTASGTVGQTLDLQAQLDRFPVGIANAFVQNLNATGTLSGSATATGPVGDPNATFDISGDGITTREIVQSGIQPLRLRLSGDYAEGTATIETGTVNVGDGSLDLSGTVGQALDVTLQINRLPVGLANGFVQNLDARGTISGEASATGSISNPNANFTLTGREITTKAIADGGIDPLSLDVAGSYADQTLKLAQGQLNVGTGSLTASGTVGNELVLDLAINELPVGLANGFVPGLGATGTISGNGMATGTMADPQAEFSLRGRGITTADIARSGIAPLTLDASGSYTGGTLNLQAAELNVGAGSLTASGAVGETLDINVDLSALPVGLANGFVDGLGAKGTISGTAKASGPVSNPNATFDLQGSGITTTQIARSNTAPLSFDAAGSYARGTVQIETAAVNVGNGSLTASGTVGQTLDVSVDLNQLPVGLANGFVDGLGAQGTLSGSAQATGSVSNPNASFDISAANVSVAQSRSAGAPSIDATLAGTYANQAVDLSQAVFNVGPGRINVTGSASAANLNLDVTIANLPASIASAAAAGIDPQGTINGTVAVNGSPSSPSVQYDINASGVSVAQTRGAGVGALGITTSGTFANNIVTTDTNVSGSGIALAANGSVNLSGTPTLNIAVDGNAPLELANRILAEGGRSITGTVAVNANITGPATQPNVTGTISTSGARFVDATANLVVNNINTTIDLNGQTATISAFSANLGQGGTIDVGGTVSLAAPFDANISVNLDNGRYTDGEIVTATLSADLTITGPLTAGPTIAGTIVSEEINVLVPENLPSSLARINVTHVNANPAVYEQQRAINPEAASGSSGGGGINLDITFRAPNQVFVRGRGLDLELGGTIRIQGSSANPEITGAFNLVRGRFGILGKRLDFQEGTLTFTGNLVPTLDLLARSTSGDVTVFIAVTGPADDPSFTFSSNPNLPQDEVLARLIFQQGTSDLSPLQIAQLAEAAASLAGVGGSTGLLENLRSQLGVDDLDISTTADGETAVGAGKYINDNIYLGVDSTGRVSVDLKLGAGLKARGSVNSEGSGEVGVFYEGEF